jgi:tetratricopeptide (TPR) repeat protein
MQEIYRSDTLLVRVVPGRDRTGWIVSFDHFRNAPGFGERGFGEAFLRDEGLSAVHIMCSDNRWYQYPDTLLACAIARRAVAGADRVMAYGSSMGAYAAIRLGKAVGATATLAISPQYSIDSAKAPWEWRWNQYRDAIARTGWLEEIDGPITSDIIPHVAFDPADMDLRHIRRIEQDIPIRRIPLPYSGHPSTGYLGEVDLLRPLLRAVHDGIDAVALMREERARRRTSSFYLGTLAARQPSNRLRTAIRLAELAVLRQPEGPIGYTNLAKLMTRAGRHGEAIAFHRKVTDMTGREGMYLPDYAEALAAAGDIQAAVAIAGETAAIFDGAAHIHHWYADMLWRAGLREAALTAARRAVEIDPCAAHRQRLAWYTDAMIRRLPPPPDPEKRRRARSAALVRSLIARIFGRAKRATPG